MQNVFYERNRSPAVVDRNRPDDVTAMGQPPGFLPRPPNLDDVLVGITSPNATVHIDLSQPGQGKQKVTDVVTQLVEKSLPINIATQRQPDFGIKAGGRFGFDRPRQPQNGNVTLDPGGVAGTFGGEDDPTGGAEHLRLIGNGPDGGKTDPKAPDGVPGLAGSPQRRERGHPPGVERRTGVGEPQLTVHKRHFDAPRRTGGHGGIGSVLRKLDKEPIPIGPNAQIPLDVGVLDKPSGRVPPGAQGRIPKPRGTEGIGTGRLSRRPGHRSLR
ncbi:hypothetical protein MUY22_07465 [Amycolatopsis sp. WQ 127309]|nr:hypothetical protein [Amycolatopsis sp. WQ 127309]UOZ08104.1 hypothetical protein MUY22_07465 [Amycolatopsis sp. WQ 127309]